MLKVKLLSLLFFLHSNGFCNSDSTTFRTYLGLQLGGTFNQGLSSFNTQLNNNSINPLNAVVFSGGLDAGFAVNRSKITLNFNYQSLQNGQRRPETQVLINCIAITLNYGYDLFGKKESIRLEPFIGTGISDLQFFIFSHDSTATIVEVASGAQNLYYERPTMGFIFDSGLRFEFYPQKKAKRLAIFGQANYQFQLNNHNWQIENMALNQLSKFHLMGGIRFQIHQF